MSKRSCHNCVFLERNYDNNECKYTFLYSCPFSVLDTVTTEQLRRCSDCHYRRLDDMCEKRFNFNVNKYQFEKEGKYFAHLDVVDAQKIVVLLNELAEENERLKKEKESWKNIACQDLSKWSIFSMEVSILNETRDIDRFLEKYYEYCADMVVNDE